MFILGVTFLGSFTITISHPIFSTKSLLSEPSSEDYFMVTMTERKSPSPKDNKPSRSYLCEVNPMTDERFKHFYQLDSRNMPTEKTNKQEHGWRVFDSGKFGNPSSLFAKVHVEELLSICSKVNV